MIFTPIKEYEVPPFKVFIYFHRFICYTVCMNTTNISFEVPDEFLVALNETKQELLEQVRLYTALMFFQEHKLSLGKAARFAGISKYDFMMEAGKRDISVIDYDPEDLEKELDILK